MLLIKTKIGNSKIHGIGLFANQKIKKGTILWKYTTGFDFKFSLKDFNKLPFITRQYLDMYSFPSREKVKYIFPVDDAKYINHSKSPNALTFRPNKKEEVVTKAIREISLGEEITEDYSKFEKDYRKYWNTKKS